MTFFIFEPGTEVLLREDVRAYVLQADIRVNGAVKYLVSYWDGNQRNEAWVEAFELKFDARTKTKMIGYTRG
jgi:hypothetical protein